MARKKDRKISADRFKKVHVTEPMMEADTDQGVVRPINPSINFPSLGPKGGDGANYDMTKHYGKGFDDITNRAFYTVKTLLNSKNGTEYTKLGYLNVGFKELSDYLAIWHHTLSRELTHKDITPEFIKGFRGHYWSCVSLKDYFYAFWESLSCTYDTPQYIRDKVVRAKEYAVATKQYEADNMSASAEIEIRKIVPSL